jgi:hypothetical protein
LITKTGLNGSLVSEEFRDNDILSVKELDKKRLLLWPNCTA